MDVFLTSGYCVKWVRLLNSMFASWEKPAQRWCWSPTCILHIAYTSLSPSLSLPLCVSLSDGHHSGDPWSSSSSSMTQQGYHSSMLAGGNSAHGPAQSSSYCGIHPHDRLVSRANGHSVLDTSTARVAHGPVSEKQVQQTSLTPSWLNLSWKTLDSEYVQPESSLCTGTLWYYARTPWLEMYSLFMIHSFIHICIYLI